MGTSISSPFAEGTCFASGYLGDLMSVKSLWGVGGFFFYLAKKYGANASCLKEGMPSVHSSYSQLELS